MKERLPSIYKELGYDSIVSGADTLAVIPCKNQAEFARLYEKLRKSLNKVGYHSTWGAIMKVGA